MSKHALGTLRLVAGPAALAGFFLPWAEGPGALASVDFSGYGLVGFTGRLSALDLGPLDAAALVVLRMMVLSAGIAALVHGLLAAGLAWHPAYRLTGWWLAGSAPAAWFFCCAFSGDAGPRAGIVLLAAGAGAFVVAEAGERWLLHRAEPRTDLVQQLG